MALRLLAFSAVYWYQDIGMKTDGTERGVRGGAWIKRPALSMLSLRSDRQSPRGGKEATGSQSLRLRREELGK